MTRTSPSQTATDQATRQEKDTFGFIAVPADRLWGAQTQRSLQNFDISGEQQPREIIARFHCAAPTAAARHQRPIRQDLARGKPEGGIKAAPVRRIWSIAVLSLSIPGAVHRPSIPCSCPLPVLSGRASYIRSH